MLTRRTKDSRRIHPWNIWHHHPRNTLTLFFKLVTTPTSRRLRPSFRAGQTAEDTLDAVPSMALIRFGRPPVTMVLEMPLRVVSCLFRPLLPPPFARLRPPYLHIALFPMRDMPSL